jgi:hypothetical protein
MGGSMKNNLMGSWWIQAAVLLCLIGSLAGCEALLGWISMATRATPAEFKLEGRKTLIMVETSKGTTTDKTMPGTIAGAVTQLLVDNKVLAHGDVVPPAKLAAVRRAAGDDFALMPIARLGRKAGAEQIVYVKLITMRLRNTPAMGDSSATVEVRVIDAVSGRRLFPVQDATGTPGDPGRVLETEMFRSNISGEAYVVDTMLRLRLAKRVGEHVARLFYLHQPDNASPMGTRIEGDS